MSDVSRQESPLPSLDPTEPPPRRLRRLHRVWPDEDGNISYLLTLCVAERARVLDNEPTFERVVAFLLDSPTHYRWFGRRFVIMPDHLHLIAHQGRDAVRLGQWVKALKAVGGGLKRRDGPDGGTPGPETVSAPLEIGSAASGDPACHASATGVHRHAFTRAARSWRWQEGFHDHKFRTKASEARKWEYICLNPVRCGLVLRPEEWPYGGEMFFKDAGGAELVRGTPPLLDAGVLIEEDGTAGERSR